MSDSSTLDRAITVDMIHQVLNLVTYHDGETIEGPEQRCEWPQLCHPQYCRFPRYSRRGEPTGLVARVLAELGYPIEVLKELDREYEIGEVLHPGVKIGRSRNAAIRRIDRRGVQLLAYLQDHQKLGWSWSAITTQAFKPRWMIGRLDSRRRPWLY